MFSPSHVRDSGNSKVKLSKIVVVIMIMIVKVTMIRIIDGLQSPYFFGSFGLSHACLPIYLFFLSNHKYWMGIEILRTYSKLNQVNQLITPIMHTIYP